MILVTGSSGFVGQAVATEAARRGLAVRAVARRAQHFAAGTIETGVAPELDAASDWSALLAGVDAVIHTAARVHVMRDTSSEPLQEFRRVNVEGTLRLARQAAQAGVRRFVFLSSIKVNGEENINDMPFRASDIPRPGDPYGVSKLEAETALRLVESETGMEVVAIRPVLVYGPGVRANFAAMMRWVRRGVPLPFGAVRNQRSLVALPNLVDLVLTCAQHPKAAGQTFLVSDGDDLSTTELLRRIAQALNVPSRLIPVPAGLLELGARVVGREDLARRLLGSLQVDITWTRERLGWTPPCPVDVALRATAAGR
jgi:nucleoside-diphosphate-sugar epimerase